MKENGGSAFPRPYSQHNDDVKMCACYDAHEGMTLRDYFAAAAIPKMMRWALGAYRGLDWEVFYAEVASGAYGVADAMLAERAKEPTK